MTDYTQPFREIFIETTPKIIQTEKSPKILYEASGPNEITKDLDRTIPSWVMDHTKRRQLLNGPEVTRFEGHTRLSLESLYTSGELGTQRAPWRSTTGHGGKNLSATDFSGINLSKAPVNSTGKRTGRLVPQGIRIDMLLEPRSPLPQEARNNSSWQDLVRKWAPSNVESSRYFMSEDGEK